MARVERLNAIVHGEVMPDSDERHAIFGLDQFGSLNLQPHPEQ
jgi:hypothetical protein